MSKTNKKQKPPNWPEKMILMSGPNYNYYRCDEHGIFASHKETGTPNCCWCKKVCPEYKPDQNIKP